MNCVSYVAVRRSGKTRLLAKLDIRSKTSRRLNDLWQTHLCSVIRTVTSSTPPRSSLRTLKGNMHDQLTRQQRITALFDIIDLGWALVGTRDAIHKEFLFKDFNQASDFMSRAVLFSEKMDHYPEWFNVDENKGHVTLSSPNINRLSGRDFKLALILEDIYKSIQAKYLYSIAFDFMSRAAVFCEKMDHYPEWCNVENIVHVTLFSRDINRLSGRDFELALILEDIFKGIQAEYLYSTNSK